MNAQDVFIVSAVRTAVGSFGRSLKDVALDHLATSAVTAALERSAVTPDQIEHVVMGNVFTTGPRDPYLSRVAAIQSGIPKETPAFNVNRLCGSGMQAIVSAAQAIALGDASLAIGAGAESMSRIPYLAPAARWGARMGNAVLVDYMTEALKDPFDRNSMGVTAENVAEKYHITRQDQDHLAFESQRRAAQAIHEGRFKDQIVPIEVPTRKGPMVFDTDEHVRPNVTEEGLAKMQPVFKKEGVVTVGNSSGINDAASALMLASGQQIQAAGLTPLARLVSYGYAGVDPAFMGMGPVPATRSALKRAGMQVSDLDVIESNEAFAAQACAVIRQLDFDPAKVNPNGSGISLGHPVGATGAILATKVIHELHRIGGRYGLATMCIGGGQGIAAIFEKA